MPVSNCIPEHLLPSFLEGELSDDESASCEEHLLNCTQCLERTRSLANSRTVANAGSRDQLNVLPVWEEPLSPKMAAFVERLNDRAYLEAIGAQSLAATSADAPTVRPETEAVTATSSPVETNSPSSDLTAGTVLGPYRILSKLGAGGMGAVYKATHIKLDKVVAVKVLSPQVTKQADAIVRFEREMRAVGKLNHPHIVQAHDAGEVNGVHYLTMEYVEGSDLAQLVKSRGPFSIVNACKAIRQSAQALVAAHGAGLVHRDIKPSNLLIGKNGQVKLLDLGLALLADDTPASAELTTAGQAFGTPDYMAPEQWEDAHSADARTDLYALGCTLFYLLIGRAPYGTERHRTAVGKMKGHVTEAIPDLKAARPDVPAEVAAIYGKLLAKAAKDRFQTAAELVEALAPFVTSKPQPAAVVVEVMPETAVQPTNVFQSLAISTANDPPPKPALRTAGRGKSWTPRQLAIAAGGAAAMLLLGVIVITIINSDGSKTKVEVGGDAQQIEVTKDGKSLVKVTPPAASTTAATTTTGWHGWPTDAPKPAIAPFDAAQAKEHQEEWAAYLKVPVEYTNSIGMKFRLIPPGEFTMGSTAAEIEAALKDVDPNNQHWQECIKSEAPQHKVILTQPIYLGVNEITQAEYQKVMGVNPSHFAPLGMGQEAVAGLETAEHPVEMVSWNDAADFCARLSKQEKLKPFYSRADEAITLLDGTGYRLPSEAEWESACRAGTATKYWIGDKDEDLVQAGWFGGNSGGRTHAAGGLKANPFGLADMHGNVWEWVQDAWDATYYSQFLNKPAINPGNPYSARTQRVVRGGLWVDSASSCRSSDRRADESPDRGSYVGFRVALPVDAVKGRLAERTSMAAGSNSGWHGWPADAPKPAIAPFDAEQSKKYQEAWAVYLTVPVEWENSVGMKFLLIPPGEFFMGSTPEEMHRCTATTPPSQYSELLIRSGGPRHRVVLTRPFYLGQQEVTQHQYERVIGRNPSHFSAAGPGAAAVAGLDTAQHPVDTVGWKDSLAFCEKLSLSEGLTPYRLQGDRVPGPLEGPGYRLPTEAEWEYACRAGTTTFFWSGEDEASLKGIGWSASNSESRTHAVGTAKPNPFGLFDTQGNVWEWVLDDWTGSPYATEVAQPAVNPYFQTQAPASRGIRGGGWQHGSGYFHSGYRGGDSPDTHDEHDGLRVVISVDSVKQALTAQKKVGWHGWPADAPQPAIAPFDAAQAKKHQEEWAAYLKVPIEYTNTIGMKFRLIPPGEFLMGSSPAQIETALEIVPVDNQQWAESIKSEGPQHQVILTQPIYVGVTEITQVEYQSVMATNPSHFARMGEGKESVANTDTSRHPVESVSWNDAAEFCSQLSAREKLKPFYFRTDASVTPLDGTGYRLPTEAEWEFACRAGTATKFWIGDQEDDLISAGWLLNNAEGRTHTVGALKANPFGLYDVHGNVSEWVQDSWDPTYYQEFQKKPAVNPSRAFTAHPARMQRSGHLYGNARGILSSSRGRSDATASSFMWGFRVSLTVDAVKTAIANRRPESVSSTIGWHGWPADAPQPAIAPFDAAQAKKHQEEWAAYLKVPVDYTNSVGMKFRLIPPDEFLMGSTAAEIEAVFKEAGKDQYWEAHIQSEAPSHRVILTKPLYLGVNGVTQKDYAAIMGKNPSSFAMTGLDPLYPSEWRASKRQTIRSKTSPRLMPPSSVRN